MILTIGNNKGGTGKTTTALNLSVALTRLKKKVLLIDNDPQCNATKNMAESEAPQKTFDVLLAPSTIDDPCNLREFCTSTRYNNLWYIPNSINSSALGPFYVQNYPNSLFYLRNKIREQALELFDYVIIDCPPTLDTPLSVALCASDAVIVPVEVGSMYSIDGLEHVLTLINSMRKFNPELKFLRLLMNRADRRTSISKAMITDIQENYPNRYFETIIPICTTIQQAEYLQQTVFTHNLQQHIITKYKNLAKELISLTEG